MKLRQHILWIDGPGGLFAGVLVLVFSGWLSQIDGLPERILIFTGIANLAYGTYSTTLAFREVRPLPLIVLLAAANLAWSAVCVALACYWRDSITTFGLFHLIGEAVIVGGLGVLEWRWRKQLTIG